jgi:hypothetical protein
VVSINVDKPDADTRRAIRSHVMQGKNLGRKLPVRTRKGVEASSPGSSGSSRSSPESLMVAPVSRQFSSLFSTISLADNVEPEKLGVVLHCELRRRLSTRLILFD